MAPSPPAGVEPLCLLASRCGVDDSEIVDVGLALLRTTHASSRGIWILAVVRSDDDRVEQALGQALIEGLRDPGVHPSDLTEAAETALLIRADASPAALEALKLDLEREVRSRPLRIVRAVGAKARFLAPKIRDILNRPELAPDLRAQALDALVAIEGADESRTELRDALQDESSLVRARAAEALREGAHPGSEVLHELGSLLRDSDFDVRVIAFGTLARWSSDQANRLLLVDTMQGHWRSYREDQSLEDRLALEGFCEALSESPVRFAPLLDLLKVLADATSPAELRWRAAHANWASDGETPWAIDAILESFERGFYADDVSIIETLSSMAFGADRTGRADRPDAVIILREISARPKIRARLARRKDDPRVGADVSRLNRRN